MTPARPEVDPRHLVRLILDNFSATWYASTPEQQDKVLEAVVQFTAKEFARILTSYWEI